MLTIVVPIAAGGGTDVVARNLARNLGKHIPGNPTIVVRNIPAGVTLVGGNFVWHAKPDGLIGLFTAGTSIMQNMLRPKGIDYYMEEMPAVYASAQGSLCLAKPDIISEPKDIMTAEGIINGHNSASGWAESPFIWAKEILGFEVEKFIWGYGGSGPARAAFLSGEINTLMEGTASYNAITIAEVEAGRAVAVFQGGILDVEGNVIRDPASPDCPTVSELYEEIYGKQPTGPAFEVYKRLAGLATYSKALLFPPDTPQDILDILSQACIDLAKDKDFLDVAERLVPGAPHFVGEDVAKGFPIGIAMSAELTQHMQKVLSEEYGLVFD